MILDIIVIATVITGVILLITQIVSTTKKDKNKKYGNGSRSRVNTGGAIKNVLEEVGDDYCHHHVGSDDSSSSWGDSSDSGSCDCGGGDCGGGGD